MCTTHLPRIYSIYGNYSSDELKYSVFMFILCPLLGVRKAVCPSDFEWVYNTIHKAPVWTAKFSKDGEMQTVLYGIV